MYSLSSERKFFGIKAPTTTIQPANCMSSRSLTSVLSDAVALLMPKL